MKLLNKIKYVLGAPRSASLAKKYTMPRIMNDEETLQYLLTENCSVCRYGDGEFNLMRGVGIKFQEENAALRSRLIEIAHSSRNNVLICLPDVFASLDHFTEESGKWWKNYLRCTRGYWYRAFRGDLYGDTNLTRFYVENKNKDRDDYVGNLKKLWAGKNVLIVEGRKTRMGMGNDLFAGAASLKRLLCPAENAFSVYDRISEAVKREIESGRGYDLMICALGPTATVLCYDMADMIRSLDLGHVDVEYEWYLAKAVTKQAVKNKAMTEVTDNCGDECDETYNSQIIGEIK